MYVVVFSKYSVKHVMFIIYYVLLLFYLYIIISKLCIIDTRVNLTTMVIFEDMFTHSPLSEFLVLLKFITFPLSNMRTVISNISSHVAGVIVIVVIEIYNNTLLYRINKNIVQ